MDHAQKYLAQANRHIAELAVQIAHQRAIIKALETGQGSEMAGRCLTRSKQVFAYSRTTGYFCLGCSGLSSHHRLSRYHQQRNRSTDCRRRPGHLEKSRNPALNMIRRLESRS
jgi:hypothetical protein